MEAHMQKHEAGAGERQELVMTTDDLRRVAEGKEADWNVKVDEVEPGRFVASLPFRQIAAEASTRDQAVGQLVSCYCELAWAGSINPRKPFAVGAPPIQHLMDILEHKIQETIGLRYDDWKEQACQPEWADKAQQEGTSAGGAYARGPQFARRNEVISGLATALAALARVKEL